MLAETKASAFVIQCLYTLYNTLGNVTGQHGKHFLVSRKTLFLMASRPNAFLLALPGFRSLACGGIVILPGSDETVQRGKCSCFASGRPIDRNTAINLTYLLQSNVKNCGIFCLLLSSGAFVTVFLLF